MHSKGKESSEAASHEENAEDALGVEDHPIPVLTSTARCHIARHGQVVVASVNTRQDRVHTHAYSHPPGLDEGVCCDATLHSPHME